MAHPRQPSSPLRRLRRQLMQRATIAGLSAALAATSWSGTGRSSRRRRLRPRQRPEARLATRRVGMRVLKTPRSARGCTTTCCVRCSRSSICTSIGRQACSTPKSNCWSTITQPSSSSSARVSWQPCVASPTRTKPRISPLSTRGPSHPSAQRLWRADTSRRQRLSARSTSSDTKMLSSSCSLRTSRTWRATRASSSARSRTRARTM
mmetsp:Transcript_50994/g.128680  ORF Transcript_50994/g.128680 Transcript_50994/m.128680 type:complete len:207 (+) Transcript_50994:789-1409(+)